MALTHCGITGLWNYGEIGSMFMLAGNCLYFFFFFFI